MGAAEQGAADLTWHFVVFLSQGMDDLDDARVTCCLGSGVITLCGGCVRIERDDAAVTS